jgi:hypothetical protein
LRFGYCNLEFIWNLVLVICYFRFVRFRVQSSTVRVVKIFDFESNTEFNRALKLAERACTEIKSKNMKKSKP